MNESIERVFISTEKFRDFIYHRHNVFCNQEYADGLPYSFHLDTVEQQGMKFMHLLEDKQIEDTQNKKYKTSSVKEVVTLALISHDVIEDGRLTYNDLLMRAFMATRNADAAIMVAGAVYCVTDEKGRNRKERKNHKYYEELKENRFAVFVKLADLAANTLFSKLTGSSMYDKYKKEFPEFKKNVYLAEFEEFFNYVENI